MELAKERGVTLEYLVGDLEQLHFENESFDVIGLIYAHFSAEKKSAYHRRLSQYLKPGGVIILEAFSKSHLRLRELNPRVGGPQDLAMLFSTTEIAADFDGYDIILLEEREMVLEEGKYHEGKGSVIRFIGIKPGPNLL